MLYLLNTLTLNVLCYVVKLMYSRRCTLLSDSNFKSIPAKKIVSLNRGILRVINTNDKTKIFLAIMPFPAMASGSGIHFHKIRDIDEIESFKKQLKHHLFLKAICEE